MKCNNIKKDLSIEYSYTKYFNKNELLLFFERFIYKAGYSIKEWVCTKKSPYNVLIMDKHGNILNLIFYLKNITDSGWENRPQIKRVQVPNIKLDSPNNYFLTTNNKTLLILGFYNYDDNPIMVAWDAYRYVKHKTLRSCYVNIDTLIKGYEKGIFITINSTQKVWVFDENHFDLFLNDYINYNKD